MALSRKHYVAIAQRFAGLPLVNFDNKNFGAGFNAGIDAAIDALADAFAVDNPRFDRARFIAACNKGAA